MFPLFLSCFRYLLTPVFPIELPIPSFTSFRVFYSSFIVQHAETFMQVP